MNTTRSTARWVGALLLAAFLLYGVGSSLATGAHEHGGLLTIGVTMMLANCVAIVAIGGLLVPVLRPETPRVAFGYLATRIFEATILAVGAIALSAGAVGVNFSAYNIAMAGLGIGSLFFCAALYRSRLVPGFLAVWGFIGYTAFAVGSVLELTGVAGSGLIAAIPGGLFEIFLAVWLITRGFGAHRAATVAAHA